MSFCPSCGGQIPATATNCPTCGQPLAQAQGKSHTVAMLLCFFFGGLGVHRFYMGKIITGILMLLTGGGLGIWLLIDFIILVFGNFHDSNGYPLYGKNKSLSLILFVLLFISVVAVLFIFGSFVVAHYTF
jgi:TM2 domain-containing membrane protein YozV